MSERPLLCYRCGSHVPDTATACGNCGQSFASGNLRKTSGTFSRKRSSGLSLEGVPFKPGDVLADRYTIKDVLGVGPLGHVLRAFDKEIDVEVALKVISPRLLQTPEERRAFSQQIRLARKLTHANVVHVYEDGDAADRPYFTMQCLDGLSLRRIIELRREKNQFFSLKEVEPIFAQLAAALDAVHRVGPHGDVKPENVIILPDLLKLSDFGLARALPCQPFVAAQKARNAHRYLSPEYCAGHDLDRRSDLYALGVLLGEMVAGVFPEHGETPELRASNRDLPPGVESLYRRAVNEAPKSRQATAGEFFGELSRLIAEWDNSPPVRRPTPRPESVPVPPPIPVPIPASELVAKAPTPAARPPAPQSTPPAEPPPAVEPPPHVPEGAPRPPPLPDDAKTTVTVEIPLATAGARATPVPPQPVLPTAAPPVAPPAPRPPIGVARPLSETRPPQRPRRSDPSRALIALMLVGVVAGVGAGGYAYVRFLKGAPPRGAAARPNAPVKPPTGSRPAAVEQAPAVAEAAPLTAPVALAADAGVPSAAAVTPVPEPRKPAPAAAEAQKPAPVASAPDKPAPAAEKRREPAHAPEPKARPVQAAAREKTDAKQEIKQALDKAFAEADRAEESSRGGRAPSCPAGMKLVPAGSFRMGTAKDDPLMGFDEKPLATVEVEAYCIDLYEYPNKPGTTPTTGVSFAAAERSCKAQGKRLCTEEEWERACKGPGSLRFPYGNAFDPDACNVKGSDDQERRVVRTGAFNRCYSAFGMADMSGNVAEWTSSHYSEDVADRTVKGGASDRPDYDVRCASRKNASPGSSNDKLGFRCCSDGS